jgi:SSS family solute:Na+ symporter/sodium/proline symporter
MIADGALLHAAFLGVYLLALIGLGAWKARSIKTQEDFSLAGRGLSTTVLVGTLLATWIGTGSIFGNAEKAYDAGVAAFLLPLSSVLGIFALFLLAPRIRRFGQFTIQDILEARYGPAARVLGTVTLLAAYVIIVSYQYRAGATVLEALFPGLDHLWSVSLVAFFVIAYTALAGMLSVAYTDVANGVLMTVGLALALPILLSDVGGVGAARDALAGVEAGQVDLFGRFSGAHMLSIFLPPLLLLLGDANVVQRFFAARDPRSARRAVVGMLIGVLILDWMIVSVALLGHALVAQGQIAEPAAHSRIVVHLAFTALPPMLGALLVGTVVAVVVSTADSYLLSPATSVVRDVVKRFVAPELDERNTVRTARGVVLVLGAIAFGLAFTSDRFFEIALFAYTIYGAGITPALLAAYFWRRATAAGAVASMAAGAGTALAWQALTLEGLRRWLDGVGMGSVADVGRWAARTEIDAVIPAVAVSVVVLVVVSLGTRKPEAGRAGVLSGD